MEHVDSFYAASAPFPTPCTTLEGDLEADVCVIGAGYTGLSTALGLAERGYHVVVLEAARIGWGASGRNGGQIINGYSRELAYIEKTIGKDSAKILADLALQGGQVIRDFSARHNIDCELKNGSILAAYTDKQVREMEATKALWKSHGRDGIDILTKADLQEHVGTDCYVGGWMDHNGGHIHPLKLAQGEALAAMSLGAEIYEQSPVTHIDHSLDRPVISTAKGKVTARYAVLAGNAYLGKTVPDIYPKVLPASTQIIVTEPLSDDMAQRFLPTDKCVEDSNYILDYFRLTSDKRLLFGGGLVYGGNQIEDIEKALRPSMEKIFPETRNLKVDYGWQGNVALTWSRLPHVGRLGPSTYFAHGYSGHGVTSTHMMGHVLATAIHGDASAFDAFAKIPARSFPGGQTLSVPLSVMGCWYYSLRDKLGV